MKGDEPVTLYPGVHPYFVVPERRPWWRRTLTRVRSLPPAITALAASLVAGSSAAGTALPSGLPLDRGASTADDPNGSGIGVRVPHLAADLEAIVYPLSQYIVVPQQPTPPPPPSPTATAARAPAATPSPPVPSATSIPRTATTPTPPSGPAPYGTVLVPGCAWASMIPDCDARVSVYSNGTSPNGHYDCTQLVRRWMRWAWNETPVSGQAYQLWDAGPHLPVPLRQHPNGGADPPEFGDVLVFASTASTPTGHTSIVSGLHTDSSGRTLVDTVEQNGVPSGRVSFSLAGTTVSSPDRPPLLGWLRPASPAPLPRPLDPITISASWNGGGGSWRGPSVTFDGPGGATISGSWSGYMCLAVHRLEPDGSTYGSASCYWDGATMTLTDPPIAGGAYSVAVQPGDEPPL